jgi:hypothetical protein
MTWYQVPYTLPVKLSDFTMWLIPDGKTEHTTQFWQEIAHASELSFPVVFHTENCADHSGNPTVFRSLLAKTTMASSQGTQQKWPKKLINLMRNLCCAKEYSVQFFVQFFTQLNCTVQRTVHEALQVRPKKIKLIKLSRRFKISRCDVSGTRNNKNKSYTSQCETLQRQDFNRANWKTFNAAM